MSRVSRLGRARWSIAALAVGVFAALGFGFAALGLAQPSWLATPSSLQSRGTTDAQKRLDALLERFAQMEKESRGDADEARKAAETFLVQVEAIAKDAKGTETAAQAWAKYAAVANKIRSFEQVAVAVEILVEDHVDSPFLVNLPGLLSNTKVAKPEQAEKLLRRMIAKSSDKTVQAASLLALGVKLVEARKAPLEVIAEGRAMLERLQKEFAGVKSPGGVEYAASAVGPLFVLDNLQIGKTPPDFEVTDENGVKFKLSDYRGKVVVLDFWGNW